MSVRPRLLIFDIDGTLILTGGAGRRAMSRAFSDVCGLQDAMRGVELGGHTDLGIARQVFAHHQVAWDAGRVQEVFDRYLEVLGPEVDMADQYRILPGVEGLLETLAPIDGVWLGLGTGNLERSAHVKLARGGLDVHFRFGGYGSDAEDRAALLQCGVDRGVAHAGLSRAELEVLIIGDTPRDVRAARKIGARVIAVATGVPSRDALAASEPDALFDTLEAPSVRDAMLR